VKHGHCAIGACDLIFLDDATSWGRSHVRELLHHLRRRILLLYVELGLTLLICGTGFGTSRYI